MLNKIKQYIEQLRIWMDQLSAREKRMIIILVSSAVAVAAIGGLYLMISSVSNKKQKIEVGNKTLTEILSLESKYRIAKVSADENKRKFTENQISLFSLLQKTADSLSLKIPDINETTDSAAESGLIKSSATLNLKQLSMDKLTAFLQALEEGPNKDLVKVLKLKVKKRFDDPQMLDAQITVATWKSE